MSKDNIEKIDEQIKLLKKDKVKTTTLNNDETVITEIVDSNDENHVINIDYLNSEIKENTKELKTLKDLNVVENVDNNDASENTQEVKLENNALTKENNNKKLFIILGVVIIFLIIIFVLLLIFSNKDNRNVENKKDKINISESKEEKTLTKDQMIKIIDDYGLKLENEINNYYSKNNSLPEFSIINNLVIMDNEVVCSIHEIYDDKKIYLDKCMVDYISVEHSYGVKQEIKEEVIDNNNVKVYVHKETKVATLNEPNDIDNYILYSSNIDDNISNLLLIDHSNYLQYVDGNQETQVYNYILGKRALYKMNYESAKVINLVDKGISRSYIIVNKDSKQAVYELNSGKLIGKEYDYIHNSEIVLERLQVCTNEKCGLMNSVTGNLLIPLEYRSIYSQSGFIIANTNDESYIFDKDGNQYLTDLANNGGFPINSVFDKYVLYEKELYNLNGKKLCKFDSDMVVSRVYVQTVNDKLIYNVSNESSEKCFVYDLIDKDCYVIEYEDCQTLK